LTEKEILEKFREKEMEEKASREKKN